MPDRLPKTSRPLSALLVGLIVAAAAAGAYLAGLDCWVELKALDLRFRYLSAGPSGGGELVRVDIDPRSLDELGVWPWPRERLAGVLDVLARCGAGAIVLDVPLGWPQEPRYETPPDPGGGGEPELVLDDSALAEAVRRHKSTFLAVRMEFGERVRLPLEAAIESALAERVTQTPEEAAATMGRSEAPPADLLAAAKRRVIRTRVGEVLSADATRSLQDVGRIVLGDASSRGPGAADAAAEPSFSLERKLSEQAYLYWRSMLSLRRFGLADEQVGKYPLREARAAPPLVTFAQAAGGAGFTAAEPDADGVIRHVRLLARSEKTVFANVALLLACTELGLRHGGCSPIAADVAGVRLSCGDGTGRAIPVDAEGRMLINWAPSPGADPPDAVRRISAADVAAPWRLERRARRNDAAAVRLYLAGAAMVDTTIGKQLAQEARKLRDAQQAQAAARQRLVRAVYDPGAAQPPESLPSPPAPAAARAEVRRLCAELRTKLQDDSWFMQTLAREAQPAPAVAPDAGAETLRKIHEARRQLEAIRSLRAEADALEAQAPAIRQGIERALGEIRSAVEGRACLLGVTAEGAGPEVRTPLGRRTPWADVDARALRTVLSGAFIRQASRNDNLVAILIAGVVAALIAATVSWGRGLMLTILLGAGYAAFNATVVFAQWRVWIGVASPLGAMAGAFVGATACRRLTEAPARRRIRAMFSRGMAPQQVRRLIADPSRVRLGGHGDAITCLDLDLSGLGSLAGRLGERKTAWMLNRCFDRLWEIICVGWGGYLTQLRGDGLFALFGVPIEQEDHASRAIQAAIECAAEARRLNHAVHQELGPTADLGCRIGLATGVAMVGNFGSYDRFEYTALGPVAKLAGRLQAASRALGANILIAQDTWQAGGTQEEVLARPLGRLNLPGQQHAVGAWEVHAGPQADEVPGAYADFARAVDLFTERKFQAAQELFQSVLAALGEDVPSQIYLARCRACIAAAPDENWDPAIRITEH